MANFGKRGRFRGGFGGRGRSRGNFRNFGGCNFEPCNLRDIFKNRDVNSFEENNDTSKQNKKFGKQRLNESRVDFEQEELTPQLDVQEEQTEREVTANNHKKHSSKEKSKKVRSFDNTNWGNGEKQQTEGEVIPKYKKHSSKNNSKNDSSSFENSNWENERPDWESFEASKSKSFQSEEDCPFPKLNDKSKQYFKRVYDQLQACFESEEEEDIFFNNVMEETVGQETFLATTKLGSRCLEMIFLKCKNGNIIRRFIEAYSTDFWLILVDLGASHVTQALLITCLRLIQHKDEYKLTDEDCTFFESWIVQITEFIVESLDQFIFHEANSTYVIRTLISVLCGKSVESGVIRRVLRNKNNDTSKTAVNFNYDSTPSSFKSLFKKLSKRLTKNDQLLDIIKGETSSPIIQVFLLVSSERYPKICQKFIKTIAKNFFSREENESVSKLFCDQYGSYVAERVFETANNEKRQWLWENFIDDQFENLCLDPKGNYIVQKILKTCSDKEEFEKIFDRIEPLLNNIYNHGYTGILSKLSEMCKVLDICQAKLIKILMTIHQCLEPVERQEEFATLLLCSKTYDEFHETNHPNFTVTLPGGLIVQNILWYHKPHKVVMSLLNMKEEYLVLLGCNKFGSHVYDALFKSTFVGEKKRDLILKKLQPHLFKLACNVYGSRCIDAIWVISNIKTKVSIAEELMKSESVLQNDRYGRIIFRNLALYNFKSRKEEWKQYQNVNTKKRKMFDDIIGDVGEVKPKIQKDS